MKTKTKEQTTTFEVGNLNNEKQDVEYLNEIEGSLLNEETHISSEWKKESHTLQKEFLQIFFNAGTLEGKLIRIIVDIYDFFVTFYYSIYFVITGPLYTLLYLF